MFVYQLQMKEDKETRPTAGPAPRGHHVILQPYGEDSVAVLEANATIPLYPSKSALGDDASTAAVTEACFTNHVSGARLLRSFLYRRRLGLLESERGFFAEAEGAVCRLDKAPTRATAGLASAAQYEAARDGREKRVDSHSPGSNATACAYLCNATDLAAASSGGPAALVHHGANESMVPAVLGHIPTRSSCKSSAQAENRDDRVACLEKENSVNAILRPYSQLRLQLAPAAAAAFEVAADIAAAPAFTPDSLPAARLSGAVTSNVADGGARRNECEKVSSFAGAAAAWEDAIGMVATLPDVHRVTSEHELCMLTRTSLVSGISDRGRDRADQHTGRSEAVPCRNHYPEQAPTNKSSASPQGLLSRNQQLLHAQQSAGRPRPAYSAEADGSSDAEHHLITVEQQREALAIAEAAAAILRRRVRALQEENERLVCSWSHMGARRHATSQKVSFKDESCAGDISDSERAVGEPPDLCHSFAKEEDEVQILRKQLAICRREVYMLSQENDRLRGIPSTKT